MTTITSTNGIAAAWSASRAAAAKAMSLTSEKRQAEKDEIASEPPRDEAREMRSPPPPPGQGTRVDVRA